MKRPARKSRPGKRPRSAVSRPRPKLLKLSPEMERWSALLGGEVAAWPGVKTQPMFGFLSYYRGRNIFAALPRTRAMNSPNSFILKFHRESKALRAALRRDPRFTVSEMAAGWQSFELSSDADLRAALLWLDRAYRAAV